MKNTVDLKTINFCGIELVNLTRHDFAVFAIERAKEYKSYISFSLNGESLAKYHYDKSFAPFFDKADFVHADGMSIVTASGFVSEQRLPERIATTDWFHNVAKLSESSGISHYFIGSDPVTIEKTISNVRKMYPTLNIVGYSHGYFNDEEGSTIIEDLKAKRPHFIWLGLGRPKQELFALRVQAETQVGLIKTCGGLFDFLAGNNRRAPELMQRLGLEWLFRLYLQPKRLFKRYLVTNYQSLKIVLSYMLSNRARASKS